MSPNIAKLLEQALDLDEKERASLAGALIESLEPPGNDNDVEAAWDEVIKRRIEELESGAVKGVPWSEVKKQLFSGFE
jgi:putative addiction module component (TIGR02574 family)